jgi:hypothetical protein
MMVAVRGSSFYIWKCDKKCDIPKKESQNSE